MSGFSYEFVSDEFHEHLMIEVLFENQRLCKLSKELGNDSLEIEFLTDLYILPGKVEMKFCLTDFEAILQKAKGALRACP